MSFRTTLMAAMAALTFTTPVLAEDATGTIMVEDAYARSSMMASADDTDSARRTPIPWVPSISLMMTGRISSPTLQAWLLMRFSCKVPSSSDEMLLLHNEPKPVVMPYKGSSDSAIFLSR